MRYAAFLDRDGVINEEVHYLHEPEKVALIHGVAEALNLLREHGFMAIVITNQAGVAKGYFPMEDVAKVHNRIDELLAQEGAKIDGYFCCPHHPDFTGECSCRKPAPGMLLEAAERFDINLSGSFMVGDRLSDVNAGINAGCKRSFLVKTGYGKEVIAGQNVDGIEIAEDILDAVKKFLGINA